jgi:limonene 1,2-monooxygenase
MPNLGHGVFVAPYHPLDENPTMCIHRDFELMEWLDKLGFDEAWIGEHHSAGFETICSPELFIAAAAERTRRLRFGTGVISLPYHNPLMVANRIIQLDHMTRGRVSFGFGPGLLASDAFQLGIDTNKQRGMMTEALDVILRLLDGETVTEKTSWYNLVEARAHLLPYTLPRPEIAVASSATPSGGKIAATYGLSMLCVAAASPTGFNALSTNWQIACEIAAERGTTMDRQRLRVVAPIHIAETREKARANCEWGFMRYINYYNNHDQRYTIPAGEDPVEWFCANGYGVVGTPDDAIELIQRLLDQQGGFGYFTQLIHDWADWEETKRSHELYARYVMPHFSGANANRIASYEWNSAHKSDLQDSKSRATKLAFDQFESERKQKASQAVAN